MALPDNQLAPTPITGDFIGAAAQPITRSVDYEDGPIAIQDPTEGAQYQVWRARIVNNEILLSAPNIAEYVLHSGLGITDVSIAFDQNARLYYVYNQQANTFFSWFDTLTGQTELWDFGELLITPKVTLDDKRATQSGTSDVILTYVKSDGAMYYRQQRDRFQVERQLDAGPVTGIEKVGKNDQYALQWLISRG